MKRFAPAIASLSITGIMLGGTGAAVAVTAAAPAITVTAAAAPAQPDTVFMHG